LTLCILADCRKEQRVALALVIPLVMKMRHVLRQRMAQRRFSKEDESRQTLLLDGSGGVSNVDIDGNNALQIKAIGVVISTFETLP